MNVLIVGLGSIAKKHINALNKIGGFTIYALRSSANSPSFDGIINVHSLHELVDKKIHFAIVSNPTSEHKKTILSLLPFKCPLFIEKPIYHKTSIEDILIPVAQAKIITYIACNLRFLQCIQYVKNEIEKNSWKINEVNAYCGSYLPQWREGDFRASYSAIPSLGGGVNIDLIHEIDYLYWMFGSPAKVYSVFKNNSSLEIESVDYANYCLDYGDFCASVILNYYRRDYKRCFEIVFENVTWVVDLASNTIKDGDKIIFESQQTINDTYLSQMEYFTDLIKSEKGNSFNNISSAYNVLKICLNDSM